MNSESSDKKICSICKKGHLFEYNNKPLERCDVCGAKARHRVGAYLYKQKLSEMKGRGLRCLHMAPEQAFFDLLTDFFADGYQPADGNPERYSHVTATKMFLPQDFSKFPQGHFQVIIHNHMLEHIPGSYKWRSSPLSRHLP